MGKNWFRSKSLRLQSHNFLINISRFELKLLLVGRRALKLRDLKRWTNLDETRGLLFFAQFVEELTFDYSLDSYKAPTTNAPYLVKELIDQIDQQKIYSSGFFNCDNVIDEMENRLRSNIVVNELLNIDINKYLSYDRRNLDDIREKVSVLRREIRPEVYAVKCMELLPEAIQTASKKKIKFLARELITTLINCGVDSNYIYRRCVDHFFGDEEVNDVKFVNPFLKSIFPHLHRFVVLFKIRTVIDNIDQRSFDLFDVKFSESVPDQFRVYAEIIKYSHIDLGERFVLVSDIRAMDPISATRDAAERIARLHDVFGIFHHKEAYYLSEEALLEQCCFEGVQKFSRIRNRMQFVNDHRPSKASKKFEDMLHTIQLPQGPDRQKFFQLVDFHGMSLSAGNVQNQLLNLWISLETIAPGHSNRTKIENVIDGILPFIGINYFRRLVERATFDVLRWNKWGARKILNELEVKGGDGTVDKLSALIILREHHDKLQNLFSKLDRFELLRFRLFELTEIFSSPARSLQVLKAHQQRVAWQIRRIYRTRNSIVHSGQTPQYTGMLVENAHDYFDQVFISVCKLGSGDNAFLTFKECFDFMRWQFEEYQKRLASKPDFDEDFLQHVFWKRKATPDRFAVLRQGTTS